MSAGATPHGAREAVSVRARTRPVVAAIVSVLAVVATCGGGPAESAVAHGGPRVLLIGDSTLAALDWYPGSKEPLTGMNYTLRAASCRAVTGPSCVGRRDSRGRRVRPDNALTVLRSYRANSFDELVLMVGYDEGYSTFQRSVVEFPAVARELGIDHITWLTFRTDADYVAPDGIETSYRGNNRLLRQAADSSNGFISLVDWNDYARSNPSVVERDGVHLSPTGARAAAQLIRDAVDRYWAGRSPGAAPGAGGSGSDGSGSGGSGSGGSQSRPPLRRGSTGDAVRELQRLLLKVGSPELASYGETGRFFDVTVAAVKRFQGEVKAKHDSTMVVDGVVGPTTWSWLDRLAADGPGTPTPSTPAPSTPAPAPSTGDTIGYGATGPKVVEIQEILLRIGAPLLEPHGATGRFFAATRDSVTFFQQMVRLEHDPKMVVDGAVGPTTRRWLERLDPGV